MGRRSTRGSKKDGDLEIDLEMAAACAMATTASSTANSMMGVLVECQGCVARVLLSQVKKFKAMEVAVVLSY